MKILKNTEKWVTADLFKKLKKRKMIYCGLYPAFNKASSEVVKEKIRKNRCKKEREGEKK